MPLTCEDVDFDLKIAEFKINGYTVFEDVIPHDIIDNIRDAYMPLLKNVMQRETQIGSVEHGDVRTGLGKQQRKNRFTVTIPWVKPFAEPAIYEHPVILEFLERYWQSPDFRIQCYHSNTPCPGTEFQAWHRDTQLLTPHQGLNICPVVGVKFPLVDTCEANGSIDVLPGTQYLADPDLEPRYDEILKCGRFESAHRVNLEKGSMWMQDVRMVHRGTPNRSDQPRSELVVCFARSWYRISGHDKVIPQTTYGELSERGEELFAGWQVVDWS